MASRGQWRWLFCESAVKETGHALNHTTDLNLPIVAVAETLVIIFLDSPIPSGTVRSKLRRMDWLYVSIYRSSYNYNNETQRQFNIHLEPYIVYACNDMGWCCRSLEICARASPFRRRGSWDGRLLLVRGTDCQASAGKKIGLLY